MADVLYVPQLVNNFFSVTAATLKGHEVTFQRCRCTISRNGQLIATRPIPIASQTVPFPSETGSLVDNWYVIKKTYSDTATYAS